MKVITAAQAEAVLDYAELVESLREAHRGERSVTDDAYLEEPDLGFGPNGFLVRPAWKYRDLLGAKLATVFPENPSRNMLTVHAVYVLFDGRNGKPLATMDGTVLTWFKTACDSALGASYLAREDAASLLMVGAGAMAPHLIRAHVAVRPSIETIRIWNRSSGRAGELATALDLDGREVTPVTDLADAVGVSEVISMATSSPYGLITGKDVAPGTHLDLVGAYTPDMREVDNIAVSKSRVYVDLVETAMLTGELLQPIEAGVMTPDDIVGDLYDLCSGSVLGRQSPDEITMFKNGGGGHLDLMTAKHILEKA